MQTISIHALREEGDQMVQGAITVPAQFLSTPSARRATSCGATQTAKPTYFYPRPPRGGRRQQQTSTTRRPDISIHALREEGDEYSMTSSGPMIYFYPRPPRGGRRDLYRFIADFGVFLSTPSARRATPQWSLNRLFIFISIHALREEGDVKSSS